jgi:hypothetical protein
VNGKVTGAVFAGLYLEMADGDMFFLGADETGRESFDRTEGAVDRLEDEAKSRRAEPVLRHSGLAN